MRGEIENDRNPIALFSLSPLFLLNRNMSEIYSTTGSENNEKSRINTCSMSVNKEQLVENINFLKRFFAEHKCPVYMIVTEHKPDKSTWTLGMLEEDTAVLLEGSDEAEVIDGIIKTPYDIKVVKTRMNAFLNTGFETQLRNDNVDLLVCGGVYTHGCVYHTAIDSSERNIRSIIASDCLSDYKPQLFPELPDILLKFFAVHGSIMKNQEIKDYLSQFGESKVKR